MREHRAFCPQSVRLGQGTKLGQADWKCVSPEEVTNSLEFLLSVSETSPVRAKRSGLSYNIPYSLCALCVDILEVYFYSPGTARQKGIRFCDRCQLIKPDRCHHCSVCAICVLKMDHHCPWVNNCIGFSNYKFFLLFLAYALLYCLYIAATVFKYFIKYWTGELTNGHSKSHVLFLLSVAVTFFVTWWHRAAQCPARTSVLACSCRKSNCQW